MTIPRLPPSARYYALIAEDAVQIQQRYLRWGLSAIW